MGKVVLRMTLVQPIKHSVKYAGDEQLVRDGFAPSAFYIPNALVAKLTGDSVDSAPDTIQVTIEEIV